MAEKRVNPARVDRNGLALLILFGASIGVYAILSLVMTGVLASGAESLSRDGVWKAAIYWLIFMAPQIAAPWLAVKLTDVVVRQYNRAFAYYLYVGVLTTGAIVFALFLLLPGGAWGVVLGLLELATAWLAWRAVRRAFGRHKHTKK